MEGAFSLTFSIYFSGFDWYFGEKRTTCSQMYVVRGGHAYSKCPTRTKIREMPLQLPFDLQKHKCQNCMSKTKLQKSDQPGTVWTSPKPCSQCSGNVQSGLRPLPWQLFGKNFHSAKITEYAVIQILREINFANERVFWKLCTTTFQKMLEIIYRNQITNLTQSPVSLYSPHKNFVKAMVLLKKLLNNWFDGNFFQCERISRFSTLCNMVWRKM